MLPTPQSRAWRCEKKLRLLGVSRAEAELSVMLHPSIFLRAFPSRRVNSLYLDSPTAETYMDNLEGVPDRFKIRVRWYHDLQGPIETPTLEIKIKTNQIGTKLSYRLGPLRARPAVSLCEIQQLVRQSQAPPSVVEAVAGCRLAALISYQRDYFVSADADFRVTIDSDLHYHRSSGSAIRLDALTSDGLVSVIEVKYARDLDMRATAVVAGFPFQVTKSSKYATALESTRL